MQTKDEALEELRTQFRNVLAAAAAGVQSGSSSSARLWRARGCIDGYMRALLDLGIATRAELLELVATERERANGPAVGLVELDEIVVA
jgi:hypothetical protein